MARSMLSWSFLAHVLHQLLGGLSHGLYHYI